MFFKHEKNVKYVFSNTVWRHVFIDAVRRYQLGWLLYVLNLSVPRHTDPLFVVVLTLKKRDML